MSKIRRVRSSCRDQLDTLGCPLTDAVIPSAGHFLGYGEDWDNALLTVSISPDGLLTSGMYAGILGARDGE